MTVVIDGTSGITAPALDSDGNLEYSGTLTGGTGVINIGSGQVYKAANGNVGIGTATPTSVSGYTSLSIRSSSGAELQLSNTAVSAQATLWCDASGLTFNNHAATNQIWNIAGTERMRIDSSGNLLVGTAVTNPVAGRVNGNGFLAAGGLVVRCPGGNSYLGLNSTSGNHLNFYTDNGSAFVSAGNISSNGGTTTYNSSSDYRMKENVQPMTGALDKVLALKPVTYTWKPEFAGTNPNGQGFIAHELQAVVPDCVTGEKDAVDAEGNPQYQGVDTSFLVATLVAAIQEQQATIAAMETRLAALEA